MQDLRSNSGLVKLPLVTDTFVPFNPKAYLMEYYYHLGEENKELLHFHDDVYSRIFNETKRACILEFGGGPTIYQLISAAKYPVSIDFSDYLDVNLDELKVWLHDRPGNFPWNSFIQYVLEREGENSDLHSIERRAQLIRSKVKQLLHCDARETDPLGPAYRSWYDIVSANFVLESVAEELDEWDRLLDHLLSLVKPPGYLVMSVVIGSERYRVGEHYYPVTPLTPEIVITKLKEKNLSIVLTHSVDAEHRDEQGYEGIFMVLAKLR